MYDKFLNGSKDFPEVIKSTTTTILSEIDNLQKLVDTFHQYAKFPDPMLKQESLNTIVEETLGLFGGEKAIILRELDASIPALSLDRGQIRQALTNLIKNSLQALTDVRREGFIKVKTMPDTDRVFLSVEDNGCGISEENRKRLFQPYFTTKKHGSGIGLALTERIISLHGGKIICASREGEGTVFKIILPLGGNPLAATKRG
jgi:two-component system nitrogen regulation sensor histidine kinase NtrY